MIFKTAVNLFIVIILEGKIWKIKKNLLVIRDTFLCVVIIIFYDYFTLSR